MIHFHWAVEWRGHCGSGLKNYICNCYLGLVHSAPVFWKQNRVTYAPHRPTVGMEITTFFVPSNAPPKPNERHQTPKPIPTDWERNKHKWGKVRAHFSRRAQTFSSLIPPPYAWKLKKDRIQWRIPKLTLGLCLMEQSRSSSKLKQTHLSFSHRIIAWELKLILQCNGSSLLRKSLQIMFISAPNKQERKK